MKLKKLKQIFKLYLLNSQAYANVIKNPNSGSLTDFNLILKLNNFFLHLFLLFGILLI